MYFDNMYFGPQALHTPAKFCSEMILKFVNLVDIGEISPVVPQIGVKTCLNIHC